MTGLTRNQCAIINRFQGEFPVQHSPFQVAGGMLELGREAFMDCVKGLLEEKYLSRFGPIYNASRLGGGQTLAAIQVPEDRFEETAEKVNAFVEIAHNYRREHRLNMWFVVATERQEGIAAVLEKIEQDTGLGVYNFPKLREFYLGLYLHISPDGFVETVPVPTDSGTKDYKIDALDRKIVFETQNGLPLVAEPYAEIALRLGVDETRIHDRMRSMLAAGIIRRNGAVPNHYRLGLRANGMTVWDVADEELESAGREVGQLPFVSHCYQRCRHEGVWSYNLFAMVHGTTEAQMNEKISKIARVLGNRCRARDVLVSSVCLKKTGLRLAA